MTTEPVRLVHLELLFDDEEERERPDLARLLHLRRNGACADMTTSDFYPARGESAAAVKAVCRGCPVRAACLAYAVEEREPWGIWGGTNEKERRALQTLRRQGVSVDRIVDMTLAGDVDEAMARRRGTQHRVPMSLRRNLPYGWRAQGEEMVPDDSEQAVIARLRAWCEEGATPPEAAARLNAEGVRTRRGALWSPAGVRRCLGIRPQELRGEDQRRAS